MSMIVRKIARPLLATRFVAQGVEALLTIEHDASDVEPTVKAMQSLPDPIGKNVPSDAALVARTTGACQVAGGLLLATGRMPRVSAAILAATVIPANLGKDMFWAETDPQRKAQKLRDFLTDASLIGALILASVDTAGKPSLGWRARRASRRASQTLLNALPSDTDDAQHEVAEKLGRALQVGAERGRDLAGTALDALEKGVEKGAPLAESAYHRGAELAAVAGKEGGARVSAGWRKLRDASTQIA